MILLRTVSFLIKPPNTYNKYSICKLLLLRHALLKYILNPFQVAQPMLRHQENLTCRDMEGFELIIVEHKVSFYS